MDRSSEFEQALRHTYDRLNHKPKWILLSTIDGQYLGHLVMTDTTLEIEHRIRLADAASGLHERRAMEYVLGTWRFGLTFAEKGVLINAFTGDGWVLTSLLTETNMTALTSTLQTLPDTIAYLAQREQYGAGNALEDV